MKPSTPSRARPEARVGPRYFFPSLAALAVLGACDLPTAAPGVESRWVVPAEETRFGVASLLPGDVSVTPDSSAFLVTFDPVARTETLADLCPACVVLDGFTAPKPAFVGFVEEEVPFPSAVRSIDVLEGEVEIEIRNDLNFDPIRPAAGQYGTLWLTIRDGADDEVLGVVDLDGFDDALPPGGTLTRVVPLGEAMVEGPVVAIVEIDSPLGDAVEFDTSLGVSVTATPRDIVVRHVEIDVAGRAVDLEQVSLDLDNLDADLLERVGPGAFVLDVDNPFGIAADFEISIQGPTVSTLSKSVAIGPEARTSVRVDFTEEELRSFLGATGVTLFGGAVVDAEAGSTMVGPGQELVLSAALDVTFRIGG